jgi:hypothetical protein
MQKAVPRQSDRTAGTGPERHEDESQDGRQSQFAPAAQPL